MNMAKTEMKSLEEQIKDAERKVADLKVKKQISDLQDKVKDLETKLGKYKGLVDWCKAQTFSRPGNDGNPIVNSVFDWYKIDTNQQPK